MTRRSLVRLAPLALQILCLVATASPMTGTRAHAATPATVGGPFTLVAQDGTTVTDRTYRGKWLLVYFGFTFCPNTCPATLLEVATALERLGSAAAALQPLFITVDPRRDTPEIMKEYTQSFDPRIVGLTGTAEQIDAVAREYGAYFAPLRTGPGADDYVIDHSSYLYLMDPRGKFVRGFAADTPGDRIADTLRELMTRHRDGASPAGPPD